MPLGGLFSCHYIDPDSQSPAPSTGPSPLTSMRFGSAIVQLLIHKCASAVLTLCLAGEELRACVAVQTFGSMNVVYRVGADFFLQTPPRSFFEEALQVHSSLRGVGVLPSVPKQQGADCALPNRRDYLLCSGRHGPRGVSYHEYLRSRGDCAVLQGRRGDF